VKFILGILVFLLGMSGLTAEEFIYECTLQENGAFAVYYCRYEDSECLKKLEEKRMEVAALGLHMVCEIKIESYEADEP